MVTVTHSYSVKGFEPEAEIIIATRRVQVIAFAFDLLHKQCLRIEATEEQAALRHALYELVEMVQEQRYADGEEEIEGTSTLTDQDFLPLANALSLHKELRRQYLRRFWRVGSFHHSFGRPTGDTERDAARVDTLEQRITGILESSQYQTTWYEQFLAQNVCRDKEAAERVANALHTIESVAASQALSIAAAWCVFGDVGLLTSSNYLYTTALLDLERHGAVLDVTLAQRAELVALVRADVAALLRVLDSDKIRVQQKASQHTRIADQSVLHQPANTRTRQRFRERLEPVRAQFAQILTEQRKCDMKEAETLLQVAFDNGLSGIVAWRLSNVGGEAVHYDWERIRRVALPLLDWLPEQTQTTILERLHALYDANDETGASLSFIRLIEDMPSSRYRRRLQKHRQLEAFFTFLAERVNISRSTASSLFKNFVVYGLFGLIEQSKWHQVVHPEIWSYLWMLKLGRVEDTVNIVELHERVCSSAQDLGIDELPRQAVSAIFTHFPKDGYYNSGDGLSTAGVPLRRSLKLAGVERLHERWLLLAVDLAIDVVDNALRSTHEPCIALIIVDGGSSCPVDIWLTNEYNEASVGLALYSALFHPAAPLWPIRGIPEHIALSQALQNDEVLRRAANYLMAEVSIIKDVSYELKERKAIAHLIRDLQARYTPTFLAARRRAPRQRLTIAQAEKDIRDWLHARYFANHVVKPAPASVRQHGVVLPGFDTPGAGWLLPASGKAVTIRDGVQRGALTYSDPRVGIEPGVEVIVRSAPARFGRTRGIFIAYKPSLLYVPLKARGKEDES